MHKKHARNDCPLKTIKICAICEKKHWNKKFPSFPSIKVVYPRVEDNVEPLCFINKIKSVYWEFQPGMPYSHPQYFVVYNTQIHTQPWYPPNQYI